MLISNPPGKIPYYKITRDLTYYYVVELHKEVVCKFQPVVLVETKYGKIF